MMPVMNADVKIERLLIDCFSCVQGVGFRPTIYRIANSYSLTGNIFNNAKGVHLDLEGHSEYLKRFIAEIQSAQLNPIKIEKITIQKAELKYHQKLMIGASVDGAESNNYSLPPDLATCSSCWDDFHNPNHRLYQYPFISCTDCGPRWSIVEKLPYDRNQTSMKQFPMCHECLEDYQNPNSRRFHSQTLCCKNCGPQLSMPINQAALMIADNKIGLVKGLTGYHLVGNAESELVIQKIRLLKSRPEKALAVMLKDCHQVDQVLQAQLKASSAPLVITNKIKTKFQKLLAPKLKTLAVMLPPTPLHFLLFGDLKFLIATSGNPKNYPLVKDKDELPADWLNQIDFILDHNRVIQHCVDDSIVIENQIIRRGRGLAPKISPHQAKSSLKSNLVAWGSDMKVSPLIQTPTQRVQLPYLGELLHPKNGERIKKEVEDMLQLLNIKNYIDLIDAHPQSLTKQLIHSQDATLIFHHHAHAESAYQELKTEFVFTFDGTGYGEDGHHWGGELLERSPQGQWKRLFSFEPMPYFAGEQMIKFPAFALAALKTQCGTYEGTLKPYIDQSSLMTTSAGRWFDALASHLFFKEKEITYEAQAAIELEQLAIEPSQSIDWKQFNFQGNFPTLTLAKYIIYEFEGRFSPNERAWLAHDGLAFLVARIAEQRKEYCFGASGGVWQNQLLRKRCLHYFTQIKKELLYSSPCNDESIALGQIGVFECMS